MSSSVRRVVEVRSSARSGSGGLVARPLRGAAAELPLAQADGLHDGDIAIVAGPGPNGPFVLERRLAAAGSPQARIYRIFAAASVRILYPPAVLEESQAAIANPGLDDPALVDLRQQPFITIDNPDSRDLDQAMYIAHGQDEGRFVVDYALADASWYAPVGSALFTESLRRGASFYLPRLAIPMMPPSLSEGIVSLNPGVERRALVMRMKVGPDGELPSTEVFRALIRSRAKLSYQGVQALHDDPESSPLAGQDYTETLLLLREVGELRMADARRRDVVSYNRRAVAIDFDDQLRFVARTSRRNDVERWNEQISLMCNMEGARLLASGEGNSQIQAIFRVHPRPEEDALRSLYRTIVEIVRNRGLDETEWVWRARSVHGQEAGESLADYIERLPTGPQADRVRQAIERQAMYAGEASSFSAVYGPHYGVGARGYSRISSPMREVVGIFTHKELLEFLDPALQAPPAEEDEAMRQRVVEAGNRAKLTQRQLTKRVHKLALDDLLDGDQAQPLEERPWRAGTVIGVLSTRLYVQLDEPPIEVKVYASHLERWLGARLEPDQARVSLRDPGGEHVFCVGDGVELRVQGYEEAVDRWIFAARPLGQG